MDEFLDGTRSVARLVGSVGSGALGATPEPDPDPDPEPDSQTD
jgi:hypothetical protein